MKTKNSFLFLFVLTFIGSVALGIGISLLLLSIKERKIEAEERFVRVVEVSDEVTDPSVWGQNWPLEYDLYKKTAIRTQTKYGGHGGSESLPREKSEIFPFLSTIYQGYAFALDYRERRGHAYMLVDQEQTKRLQVPQSASCLHCHSAVMPLYKKLGDGDVMKGFEVSYRLPYAEGNKILHEIGHAHPVTCADCHDPKTMNIRVTRPGFIKGIQALANSDEDLPQFPSIEIYRQGNKSKPYDPNTDATRNEMRTFVCAQCHVEYYCGTKLPLIFPWGKGLKVEKIEAFWDDIRFQDGESFYDFRHKLTKAKLYKAQHPEFELWSQGNHARSGVACADCHMPYFRIGATKVSDHWVRSPLLNINRACQTCHAISEGEIRARVENIQDKTHELLQSAGRAVEDLINGIVDAYANGATEEDLGEILDIHRKAQWLLDFISSENSMGFHAPQEAMRILANAIDYARKGQMMLFKWKETKKQTMLIKGG